MTIIVLQPSEVEAVPVTARWLSIINTTAQFQISAPNLSPIVGRTGRQYDLQDFNSVDFKNIGSEEITIEIEVAGIGITQPGSGLVQVENSIIVERINEFPALNLNADIQSIESVGLSSNNTLATPAHINVPANSQAVIVNARQAVGRVVTLQLLSEQETTLHIGSDSTINANRGIILRGSLADLSSAEIRTQSALRVFNASSTTAKIAVMEQYAA